MDESDFYVLVAGKKRVSVDKEAIKSCSKYFQLLSAQDMKEKYNNVVELKALDDICLKHVADYANNGKTDVHLDNVTSVIIAGDYLCIPGLLVLCEDYLWSMISCDACVDVMNITENLAQVYNLDKIYQASRRFVHDEFNNLSPNQYSRLSKEDFLCLLRDGDLKVDEWKLVGIVGDWMRENRGIDLSKFSRENIISCGQISDESQISSENQMCCETQISGESKSNVEKYIEDNTKKDVLDKTEEPWSTFIELTSEIRWLLIDNDEHKLDNMIQENFGDVMKCIPESNKWLDEIKEYNTNVHSQPLYQGSKNRIRAPELSFVSFNNCEYNGINFTQTKSDWYQRYDVIAKTRHGLTISNPGIEMHRAQTVQLNNFLFVCGATMDVNEASARCYRYDPHFDTWLQLSPMLVKRYGFTLITTYDKIYAIGGYDMNKSVITKCEIYDIKTDTWSFLEEDNKDVVVVNSGIAGCGMNDSIFISGGYVSSLNQPRREMYKYDTTTNKWYECPSMIYNRYGHTMVNLREHHYVIGGENGNSMVENSIERYSIRDQQWTVCKQRMIARKAKYYVNGNDVLIFGGLTPQFMSYFCKQEDVDYDYPVKVFNEEVEDVVDFANIPYIVDPSAVCAIMHFPGVVSYRN